MGRRDVDDYEYRGLVARSWDLLRGDTSEFPDREFFRDLISRSGEPALIVGCGTGRLLLDYQAGGLDVDGADVSPEMVAICQQKAATQSLPVTVFVQPMEAMQLPRNYRTIVVPSSSFQLVPDLEQADMALNCFFNHLLPGGTLVMSIWHILDEETGEWGDWWQVAERDGFEGGRTVRRWERSRYDSGSQLRFTENRFELLEDGAVVYSESHRRSPELRDYSISQVTAKLDKVGFSAIHAVSGFSNERASDDDEVFCIFGKRA